MHVIFLPFCTNISELQTQINADPIQMNTANQKIIPNNRDIDDNIIDASKEECAKSKYSKEHTKYIFTQESGITQEDIDQLEEKIGDIYLGNGINDGVINGKPYTVFISKGGSDYSNATIQKMLQIVGQVNAANENN